MADTPNYSGILAAGNAFGPIGAAVAGAVDVGARAVLKKLAADAAASGKNINDPAVRQDIMKKTISFTGSNDGGVGVPPYNPDQFPDLLSGLPKPKSVPNSFAPAAGSYAGQMRTDRNNNPTAMTVDVASTLGLQAGTDYIQGDPFQAKDSKGNPITLYTAKLNGNGIETTIKALDLAAQDPNKKAFYTLGGSQRWTHTAISDNQWLAMSPDEKRQTVLSMYKHEGGRDLYSPNAGGAIATADTTPGIYTGQDEAARAASRNQNYQSAEDLISNAKAQRDNSFETYAKDSQFNEDDFVRKWKARFQGTSDLTDQISQLEMKRAAIRPDLLEKYKDIRDPNVKEKLIQNEENMVNNEILQIARLQTDRTGTIKDVVDQLKSAKQQDVNMAKLAWEKAKTDYQDAVDQANRGLSNVDKVLELSKVVKSTSDDLSLATDQFNGIAQIEADHVSSTAKNGQQINLGGKSAVLTGVDGTPSWAYGLSVKYPGGNNAAVSAPVSGVFRGFGGNPNSQDQFGAYAWVEMPNGDVLRISHLSNFNTGLKDGDKVDPNTVIGNQGDSVDYTVYHDKTPISARDTLKFLLGEQSKSDSQNSGQNPSGATGVFGTLLNFLTGGKTQPNQDQKLQDRVAIRLIASSATGTEAERKALEPVLLQMYNNGRTIDDIKSYVDKYSTKEKQKATTTTSTPGRITLQ